ncbi:hypothetical protein [Nostoc sp.]|uniref:hypothetical protein n=1 Tax=Nostoc sp. TaxID=1180 RepID=UPI002FF6131D
MIYKGLKCELNPNELPCKSQSSPDCSVSTERIALEKLHNNHPQLLIADVEI